ncbi:UNVERIFIED_CONTAM: hypothetical protein RF648_20365 [Kocuria sp. CPCC 205274]
MKTVKSNPARNVNVDSLLTQFKFAVKRFGIKSQEAQSIASKLYVLAPNLFKAPVSTIGKVETKQAPVSRVTVASCMKFEPSDYNLRDRH